MIEIPADLHRDLVPLAFLLGNWQGAGVADPPGEEQCNFGQELTFGHDGRDFLEYSSHTWRLDGEGRKVSPLESEHGFWRIKGRELEVVTVRDQGVVEVWYGQLAEGKPQIDLATENLRGSGVDGLAHLHTHPATGSKHTHPDRVREGRWRVCYVGHAAQLNAPAATAPIRAQRTAPPASTGHPACNDNTFELD
jgi:hypothetical protein